MKIKTSKSHRKRKNLHFYRGVPAFVSGEAICHDFISGRGQIIPLWKFFFEIPMRGRWTREVWKALRKTTDLG
jgi:hypothetical protein